MTSCFWDECYSNFCKRVWTSEIAQWLGIGSVYREHVKSLNNMASGIKINLTGLLWCKSCPAHGLYRREKKRLKQRRLPHFRLAVTQGKNQVSCQLLVSILRERNYNNNALCVIHLCVQLSWASEIIHSSLDGSLFSKL